MKTDIATQMKSENPDKVLDAVESHQRNLTAIGWPRHKEDHRPPRGAWCDGEYMCVCINCKQGFIGDKRAFICADCAYAE